jgi:hypothetical protein
MRESAMRNATRSMVTTIGILCGVSGLEHGFFEVLQGNTAAEFHLVNGRPMIYAIGDSLRFWPYGYEYAFTIIPNYLVTGILAMLTSLLVIVCTAGPLHRKYGWRPFIMLSTLQYLFGGGAAQFGPAIVIGLAAIGIDQPLIWPRAVLPLRLRQVLGKPWLWLLIVFAFIFCHSIVTAVSGFFYGLQDPEKINQMMWAMLYVMIVLLPLTILSTFSQDSLENLSHTHEVAE